MKCKYFIDVHVGQHYCLHEILLGVLRQATAIRIRVRFFTYAAHATLLKPL